MQYAYGSVRFLGIFAAFSLLALDTCDKPLDSIVLPQPERSLPRNLHGCTCETCSFLDDSLWGWRFGHAHWPYDSSYTVWCTRNGAGTWQAVGKLEFGDSPESITFADSVHGWIATRSGRILRTIDGGSSWKEQYKNDWAYWLTIEFPTPDTGYVGGGRVYNEMLGPAAMLYRTTDSGNTWHTIIGTTHRIPAKMLGASSTIFALHFPHGSSGYAEQHIYNSMGSNPGSSYYDFCLGDWTDVDCSNIRYEHCEECKDETGETIP